MSPPTPHDLLEAFAERTGLVGNAPQRRYLWTDAFAVCTYLGLGQRDRALALIDHVHHELGRHRSDDSRRGWISGLSDADGELHPTVGGLRIGKPLPEREPGEPLDDRLEWDRDGQYFHYLTKWMHALDQTARLTRDTRTARWARELADTSLRRFVYELRGTRRMYWKMSIDLTRPLVPSMGHHDPLDGYVTCLQLEATATLLPTPPGPDLGDAVDAFRRMIVQPPHSPAGVLRGPAKPNAIDPVGLTTSDPLGIGGLLVDAYRLAQLDRGRELQEALLAGARRGLARYVELPDLRLSASHRLAFRELGLAIGLAAAESMRATGFGRFTRLRHAINDYWLDATHRGTRSYIEHADINDVMLAASLAPTGCIVLPS